MTGSRTSAMRSAVLDAFNTHNKYTGVCRFVRGFLWDRPSYRGVVGFLWGSAGTPSQLTQSTARVPRVPSAPDHNDHFPGSHRHRSDLATSGNSVPATRHPSRPMSAFRGSRPGCLRLAEMGSNLTDPAVDGREEAFDAAVGKFSQWDLRPLAAQDILAIKAWYPQGV